MTLKRPSTEVMVAIIGLIGVLGAAVIANWEKIFPPHPPHNGPVVVVSPSPGPSSVPSPSNPAECLTAFLQDVPKDRVRAVEAGAKDLQIIGPDQSKDERIALTLEENKRPVGAIKFRFFSNGTFVKIDSIVDSQCQPIEEFVNVTHGGDKHILQNYDDLEIQFGNVRYVLGLEYGTGRIDATFGKISP